MSDVARGPFDYFAIILFLLALENPRERERERKKREREIQREERKRDKNRETEVKATEITEITIRSEAINLLKTYELCFICFLAGKYIRNAATKEGSIQWRTVMVEI